MNDQTITQAELESTVLTCSVEIDSALASACLPFDYSFDGTSRFTLPKFEAPQRDGSWSIGLIVGPSGSGKTQLLKRNYGITEEFSWNPEKAIVSQIQDASDRFGAVGLNSVPSWCRPFHVLSNGEQFRAGIAAKLENDASFDEFTSVVDRTVAKACCNAIQRHIRNRGISGVVFASCHYDVIEWLQPDWVFDTVTKEILPRGSLRRREKLVIEVFPCGHEWWTIFKSHHYMSSALSSSSTCWLGSLNGNPIAFASSMRLPSGTTANAWREHRTVVLPDYQGLGIGMKISDSIADMHKRDGCRYYSKTAHPRMGAYRDRSPLWRPTKHNHKVGKYSHGTFSEWRSRTGVYLFSHEYIGADQ